MKNEMMREKILLPAEFDFLIRNVMRRFYVPESPLIEYMSMDFRWCVHVGHVGAAIMFSTESLDAVFEGLPDEEIPISKDDGTFGPTYRVLCTGAISKDIRPIVECAILTAVRDIDLAEAVRRLTDNTHLPALGRDGLAQLAGITL